MIMQPAGPGAIDQICHDIERFWMLDFSVNDIWDGIITEVDLEQFSTRGSNDKKNPGMIFTISSSILMKIDSILVINGMFPNTIKA